MPRSNQYLWLMTSSLPFSRKGSDQLPGRKLPWFLSTKRTQSLTHVTIDPFPYSPPWVRCYCHCETNVLQFGFRTGRSTYDLLLSHAWQDTLDERIDTLVVALDIAGASDRVWHSGLLAKLRIMGIDRSLLTVVNGRASVPAKIKAIVPKDSILGPVM